MRGRCGGKRRLPRSLRIVIPPSLFAIPLLLDDPESEPEAKDIFEKNICICCEEKGSEEQEALVCSERGCPVSVHASCLGSDPQFDDSGKFFCPYCWFKRAVRTCRCLGDKALTARQAMARFLDMDDARANSGPARVSSGGARVNVIDREEIEEDTRVGADSGVGDGACMNQVQDREEIEEDARVNADFSGGAARVNPNWDREGIVEEARVRAHDSGGGARGNPGGDREEIVEDTRVGVDYGGGGAARVEPGQDCEEIVEESETDKSGENKDEGKVYVSSSSVSETIDSESEAVIKKNNNKRKDEKKMVGLTRKLRDNKHYNTRRKAANEEEVTSFRYLRQQPQRMKLTAKRRRLLWTAEEEKVLKEGVSKFSTENQNIPWRKILEFGCRVFDKTRTPVDLKDKWKNIISKEGWKN
ncbi:hypothetical protein VNO78_23477 [Psophocarpus tetragonolobus]|uniref:Myb-like domain-containing protein n=1 Tax=Psophocarpus tetragonolobus TaxID=3891 RepID=A0AAN9S4J5_PSOTE